MPYGSREKAYKNADSLSYLTAEQALADYAVFITDLKRNLSAEASPVVLFGGSYGGMLAAWMRLKYPHIAIGALASSAPILQFEDIVPTATFYDIVSNDFKRESISCFDAIKKSWEEIEVEGKKENGLLHLTKRFHMCQSLNSTEDLSDWLESAYSYLAMVDYPYPSSFLMPLPASPIKEVCRKIDSFPKGTSILERIFAGVSIYYNYTGTVDCFDLADDPHGMSGWDWQACTEMVMPMSSSRNNSMFPTYDFDYASYQEQCVKEFGIMPRPRWITTEFGGHNMRTSLKMFGSNIIFSNGLLDPWSGGGVLQNLSETIVALVTKEGAHHIDLRASTDDDPDWLVEQRKSETKLIKGWIDNYYQEKIGPLKWNTTVANYAKDYSQQRSEDCVLVHSQGPDYGENLYLGTGLGQGVLDAAAAVKGWVGEIDSYDYNSNTCDNDFLSSMKADIVVWRNVYSGDTINPVPI
ncbi:Lysosomal pro-x carboxypeptidase [Thalictrum thalictroides]|uniref:Lysosomal pro-x carboxypeptidase n=1 Tax=Thalictrum thalictroides TaxID=46969 RepID=A0A7J6WMG7_THATH|nr:Lysosomal pro-x carboxypeptidase [Thalictrum thalictroides]